MWLWPHSDDHRTHNDTVMLIRQSPCNVEYIIPKNFTARVSGTPADPSKHQRQNVYFRALRRYLPEVEVYFGHFLSHKVRVPLAQPAVGQRTAEVIRTEEKGSDVNLAVHLLNDGWLNAYDCDD